ncbi:PGF-pre-PGF domain-containing protein, partial [Candidatus Woesearchaeota archaeon]|nr:PGF-pre-PGF domain-containing protein [Candidatus Woesearchaeota archaeon]
FYGNYSTAGFYNITVIINDGELTDTQTWNFTVNNTNRLPAAQNVNLTSTDSLNRTNGNLITSWGFYDPDGETQLDNETKWYNNSVEVVGLRNLTIVGSGNTTKNNVWLFSVRVYDGYDWGNWTNSTALTIKNTPPTAPTIDLSPDVPVETDNLLCNVTVNSTDADNDVMQYYYNWYKNNILNRTTLKTQVYDILGSGNISTLDEWNCTVIPYDGEANGSAASAKVMVNTAPEAVNPTLISTDSLNRTNGTLVGSWDFYDADGHSQQNNETKWYNNSVEVASLAGSINVGSSYTRKAQNWTFSARVYDGYDWSVWVNSTILTIQNLPPVLATIADITVNETGLINITASATDEDALTYDINDSRFTRTDNHFTWQTTLTDSGVYVVAINVTDGSEVDSQNLTVTVLDAVDFDNDGNPDFNDTDDDNDGIDDSSDRLTGDITNINSTITLKLRINGSESTAKIFNETLLINITDANDNSLVEFNWSFDAGTLVVDWTINYNSTAGTIRIANLDLTSQGIRKTVYINQSSSSYNYVCISDISEPPASLPSDCSGYTRVACSGSSGQYTCTDLGNTFKVSGLDHSAVRGIQYTPPSDGDGGDGGGGGGARGPAGGFGYGGSTVKKTVLRLNLVPDEIYRIELDLADLALTHNYFSINKSLPQVKITMEKVSESDVELPLVNAYQYFRITAEGMTNDDLKNAELESRISKDWLEIRDYDENLVALSVYDGTWSKLPTIRAGTIDNELYFVSTTDKFGYFAITSEPKVIPPPVLEEVIEAAEEEAEEITEEVPEERRKTWRDWLPVITISEHRYLIALGLVVLVATIITAYHVVSRIKHPYPKLSKYIKLSLDKGKNKNKIKKELVDSGWPENIVNDELKKYKKKNE